ncbi:hypothetical protein PHYPSEUDO_004952 [Phytophthora pseudosyringae]|uniref:Uncharacterized protein n=1 Tax=Phytophthora pseudosyringae TaxID=221518 RepID=A0A8T1WCK9_9STRA|nr:hypothetical protein PHYPSEUDO_004952 [Phytophthora pseudosyringae]
MASTRSTKSSWGDNIFVNVDLFFQFPAFKVYFAKRYKRSVRRFIDEENLQVVVVPKQNAEKRELKAKPSYAPKSDTRLMKKHEPIVRLLKVAKKSSYPLAPSVIKDEDLSFFVGKTVSSFSLRSLETTSCVCASQYETEFDT